MASMTQKIVPFLWFDNDAEEAVNFYISLFDDGKILSTSRYGANAQPPGAPDMSGKVLVMEFEIAGQKFAALNGGPVFKPNEAISFFVNCDTQAELDRIWDKIGKNGGQAQMCGWIKDKWGFAWQIGWTGHMAIMGSGDQAKADRLMQAVLKMTKYDIAAAERAADGK
jgi:predicted 3-demethylubiquinone-9 3-methyltransferase (glyoxalase superfamily)